MIEMPRLNPSFRTRMETYLGGEREWSEPATLESIADELRKHRQMLAFVVTYLDDEERTMQIRDALRYPKDHVILGAWIWLKAFALVAGGAFLQWLFSKGKP